MSGKRTYGDPCATARALDLVGERWALLVVRELLLGPKRFTDLRASLPNVSPDVLSQRLRELETAGVLRRRKLPPPASARVYDLTPWGRELEEIVLSLGRWGCRIPYPQDAGPVSADTIVLALKALFDPGAADGVSATYGLRFGEQEFTVRVAGRRLDAARGVPAGADATLVTDPGTLAALLWDGRDLREALREGDAAVEGDRRAVERLLTMFPLPEPVADAA